VRDLELREVRDRGAVPGPDDPLIDRSVGAVEHGLDLHPVERRGRAVHRLAGHHEHALGIR
jgi:hypothetical protein